MGGFVTSAALSAMQYVVDEKQRTAQSKVEQAAAQSEAQAEVAQIQQAEAIEKADRQDPVAPGPGDATSPVWGAGHRQRRFKCGGARRPCRGRGSGSSGSGGAYRYPPAASERSVGHGEAEEPPRYQVSPIPEGYFCGTAGSVGVVSSRRLNRKPSQALA
jgi:hypothetical protein